MTVSRTARRDRAPIWASFDDAAVERAGPPLAPVRSPTPPSSDPGAPLAGELDRLLDETRAQGHLEGHARGLAQATADRAELTRQALDAIARAMVDAQAGLQQAAEHTAEALGSMLLAALSAMLPTLCARYGTGEIAALAQAIVPALHRRPDVTVEVHPAVLPGLDGALARMPTAHRRRMLLTPCDDLAPGDARLSWADGEATGHAVRDGAATWARVRAVLAGCGVTVDDSPATHLERVP